MLATLEPTVMNFTYSPNDTVLGRYTIRRGIGVGGFGEVYFAISQAGKEVALKRIQRNLAVELRGVSHCLNLKHPNLVSLHDICRDQEDQAWVVMEYVAGKNLREVLDDANPSGRICTATTSGAAALPSGLSIDEVRRWFSGMAAGTAHLHAAGLVHRDLKPGNLFDDNGIIKVGDYGLSKFISLTHRSGHTESIGTLHYMAPEIGRGQYGREIDIYACGIILYELLTGSLPLDGETPQEIIVRHLTDKPDLSKIPHDFQHVIAACLEKDPTARPSNIDAMMKLTPWADDFHSPTAWSAPSAAQSFHGKEPEVATPSSTSSPASLPHVVLTHPSGGEPIARAVGNAVSSTRRWWRNLECSPVAKLVIAVMAAGILLINTHWLLPLLSLLAFVYLPYFVIRQIVLQVKGAHDGEPRPDAAAHYVSKPYPSYDGTPLTSVYPEPVPVRLTKLQTRKMLRKSLAQRSRLSLAAEWTTSALISLVVAAALLVVSAVTGLRHSAVSPLAISPFVWMACVIWLGSTGLLAIGKAWESSDGEGFSRRLTASVLGAGVGLVAYLLATALMVPLGQGVTREIEATSLMSTFYTSSGEPTAAAMMAHFASLFALLRMWKLVDPIRRRRLSLWAIAVAVVGEWVVQQFIPIPQPAGMLLAGGIVLMSQISAPWVKSDSISSLIST